MIDLHCHSYFSDGFLSPKALLDKANEAGITLLALTDHDTVEGSRILMEQKTYPQIKVITGIELSVRWKKYDIHILGYNLDLDDSGLSEVIQKQRSNRTVRAQTIGKNLETLGVKDAYIKACTIAGHEGIGRPHFAQVLVDEGLVKDRQEGFKRFLGRGKQAYVPTAWISIEEAVSTITKARGQAVIAHPMKYNLTRTRLQELILTFKLAGGCGIEVISGEITNTQIQEVVGLSLRFQLLASTGSDYHGDAVSRISLGRQRQLPVNCKPIWHEWNI
jgi:predicted metal-dependent phosphoesterase TrpH